MTVPRKEHSSRRLVLPATGFRTARRPRGTVRTCIPALGGRGGYREPAEPGPEPHIVRGED
jgi:hypothetical protein